MKSLHHMYIKHASSSTLLQTPNKTEILNEWYITLWRLSIKNTAWNL